MNIGIDIDDTINNLHEIIFEKGKEFNKCNSIVFNENPNEWDWDKAFGWNDELALKFLHQNIEDSYLSASIKENAVNIINKLYNDGHKIFIITSRSKKHCKDPFGVSEQWLKQHNIKYNKLIVGAENKASVCMKNDIDVFIDDHVDFCEGVSKTSTKVLMFNSPYNQNETRYKRVNSWEEVYKNILEYKK